MPAFSPVRIVATAVCVVAAAAPALAQPAAAPAPRATTAVPLADFYLAKRGTADTEQEFELRLRDDGKAWLVTALPTARRFETGTWKPDGAAVRIVLDTTAPVSDGSPASPSPETETLTFSVRACTLALVSAAPATLAGGGALAFTKRHCP